MRFHSPMIRSTYQAAILSGISNVLAQAFQARRKAVPLHIDPFELARFVIVTLSTSSPPLASSFPSSFNYLKTDEDQ